MKRDGLLFWRVRIVFFSQKKGVCAMLWLYTSILILISWLIGLLHMSRVSKSEHGKLRKDRFIQRVWLYTITLTVTFLTGSFQKIISDHLPNLPSPLNQIFLIGMTGTFLYWIFVISFSYLDAFWYQQVRYDMRFRKSLFYWIALPIVYSSLYLYWVMILSVWAIYIYLLQQAFSM